MHTAGDRLSERVQSEYAGMADQYDRRWSRYLRESLGTLRPLVAGRELGRVLDLGCGTGALSPRLQEWGARLDTYVGTDFSEEMLRRASERLAAAPAAPRQRLVAADAQALPFHDAEYDTVVSASTLHYWRDPAAGLAEARRVVAPGGRLLLLDWSRRPLTMRALDRIMRLRGAAYRRMYAPGEMADLLRRAAFAVRSRTERRVARVWGVVLFEAVPA
jgi:ubiquinone/menaquinone biosynthesis C-methylase UbiE